MQARIAVLPDRGVVRVTGEDAEKLLQGVVTNDMDLLADRPAVHAALLTPQGKILFEFFVVKAGDGNYLLETGADQAAGLAKRLAMYKLRAKATIEDASAAYRVLALWGGAPASTGETTGTVSFPDPRLPALGMRILAEARFAVDIASATNGMDAAPEEYHAHRIALGVPEAGKDYALGDTFPHEADMDQLGGVSFSKGCFVGQEVVSRMQHRAHVRKRVMPIDAVGTADLQSGTEVMAGAAAIGKVGSVAGRQALALLRLDRAAEAKAKAEPLTAGGVAIAVRKPGWATFDVEPTDAAETT
jgi:folate-binding protein YgfZ